MDTCESGEVDPDEQAAKVAIATSKGARGLRSRGLVRDSGAKKQAAEVLPKPRNYVTDRDRFIYNDLVRRSGAIVVSSSRGSEASYELDELHNGVFTESILRALTDSEADTNRDGEVSTAELLDSLTSEVPSRTQDLQHPTIDRDNPSITLALPLITFARDVVDR